VVAAGDGARNSTTPSVDATNELDIGVWLRAEDRKATPPRFSPPTRQY
jgi:hypothetical protein